MNYKTTLILIVLLLLSGAAFFWLKSRSTATMPTAQDDGQGQRLVAERFKTDQVTGIQLEIGGKAAIFRKEIDAWWQNEPARFELNDWAVRDLLEVAASLRSSHWLIPGQDDAPTADKLGFSPFQGRLVLMDESGKPLLTLALGRLSLGGRAYLRLNDDPKVYVVGDRLHRKLMDQPLDGWRRKTLHPAALGQLDGLTLTHSGQTIDLKQTDGKWTLAGNRSDRIDSEALAALIGHLNGTYIQKFIAEGMINQADFGLNHPTLRLQMRRLPLPDHPEAIVDELLIGAPSDLAQEHYYAMWTRWSAPLSASGEKPDQNGKVVFEIAKSDLDKLKKKVDDLRDGRILLAPPNEIRWIHVRSRSEDYRLERTGGRWEFPASENQTEQPMPVDQADVAQIIEHLSQAKALGFAKASDESELATITLQAAGRNEPEILKIHRSDKNNQRLVYRQGDSVGAFINAKLVDAILQPMASLRERTLLQIKPESIKRILIRHRGQRIDEWTRADSTWRLNGSSSYEKPALEALLKAVNPLRAVRWITEVPPTQPMADLTLEVIDSNDHSLVMHLNTRGRVACVPGLHLAELDEATVNAIDAEMAQRTILSMAAADMAQLTIRQGKEQWSIRRLDNGRYFSDQRLELSHVDAAALFDVLAGLRAMRFVDPALFDRASAWATLEIQPTHPQETVEIQLACQAENIYGRLGDRTFLLDQATARKFLQVLDAPSSR